MTAIASKEHLIKWMNATGREFIIFKTDDLLNSMPWPECATIIMQLVNCYRAYRQTLVLERAECPKLSMHRADDVCTWCQNEGTVIIRTKQEILELDEMKMEVDWLMNQIRKSEPAYNP